jgi:hypothetical protein
MLVYILTKLVWGKDLYQSTRTWKVKKIIICCITNRIDIHRLFNMSCNRMLKYRIVKGKCIFECQVSVYRKYPLTISTSDLWTYEPYFNLSLSSATKWIYFSAWTYNCSCITHQQIWNTAVRVAGPTLVAPSQILLFVITAICHQSLLLKRFVDFSIEISLPWSWQPVWNCRSI